MILNGKSKISWLAKTDFNKGMDFIHNHWKKDHILSRDKNLFKWLYKNEENQNCFSILVSKNNDLINSFLGIINHKFCINGFYFDSAWLAIWVNENKNSSSEGLMLLKKLFRSNYDIIGTQGFSEIAKSIYRGLHFEMCDRLPRLVKIFNLKRIEQLTNQGTLKVPLEEFLKTKKIMFNENFNIRKWNDTIDNLLWENAWDKIIAPKFIGVARNCHFINWRYLNHPTTEYTILVSEKNNQLYGLIAFHIQNINEHKILRIIDLIYSEQKAAESLLFSIEEICQKNQITFADFYCSNKNTLGLIKKFGYLQTKKSFFEVPNLFSPLIYEERDINLTLWTSKKIREIIPKVFEEKNFYFTISEVDQDRPN